MGSLQLAAELATGLFLAVSAVQHLCRRSGRSTSSSSTAATEAPTKAWLLVVSSKFQSLEDRDALLEHVRRIAQQSANHEPGTLGFQVAIADNDPLRILVFERFANKEAWLEAHRNSTVYKKYKAWQAAANIQAETTGQSYDELGWGFLTEAERAHVVQHSDQQ
mmetsp:Transcript_15057/g.45515  ORF Transcript_15057/g.45515 Transcript_15057/m.45515 type:complete len:164 (-) Transcript_15057:627-1118(-)|eukprot:CAMPEP_0206143254 /NCGR_PEP_ID=MMETSP1473-20131121/19861_1 /ASSEMBLY_ACC=CAM_ASM_001109 /TAXON_ID=1461547 /ORGANISM="Stichococcus sp, Strain RCC1054" /LENGTH=163 /DNA_ID=CAMNT_0053538579 /DNA_START=129 /DNA_END=620 /DNA_ORIENTATION=+